MIATRCMATRAFRSFAQQIGVSVLATLAATAMLAGLREEVAWPPRPALRPAAPAPSLTTGGKFAARALDGDAPQDGLVTLVALPAVLPMFTAPVVPPLTQPEPARRGIAEHADLGTLAAADLPSPRGTSRREPKRAASVPHRPADTGEIKMAALPRLSAALPEPSLWSRSKAAYTQIASWGDTMVDALLP